MNKDLIVVQFMASESGKCEDLYWCPEHKRVFIRQAYGDDRVRWLTASKWTGGYEADCHFKAGVRIQVVNKDGKFLFDELTVQEEGATGTWAEKIGPFSWEPPKALAEEYARRLGLRSYEEWKAWLMVEAKTSGFVGYSDNWLFAMAERKEPKKIDQIDYLGITAYVTVQEKIHEVCGKRWRSYEVMTEDLSTCLAICGYKFEEG